MIEAGDIPCPFCGSDDVCKVADRVVCPCGASAPKEKWNERPIEKEFESMLESACDEKDGWRAIAREYLWPGSSEPQGLSARKILAWITEGIKSEAKGENSGQKS